MLLRGNGTPVFLLANVVDDMTMRITHVVRAEEHLPNTPKQQLIWEALGHAAAGVGARAGAGERAAQEAVEAARQGGARAVPRRGLPRRRDGQLPDDARLVARRHRDRRRGPRSRRTSGSRTSTSRRRSSTSRSSAAFNGEYIRMLSVDEFVAACEPWLPAEWDRARFAAIAPHIQQRLVTLADAPGVVDFLFAAEPDDRRGVVGQGVRAPSAAGRCCAEIADAFAGLGDWDADALKATLEDVMEPLRAQARQGAGAGAGGRHRPHGRPAAVRGARGAGSRRDAAASAGRSASAP